MKNLTTVLLFSSLLFTAPAMAGSDHEHGHSHGHAEKAVSDAEAIKQATKKVKQLANSGKIDKSWATITASKAEKKTFAHDPEWVISFKNSKVADSSKQTLYVFLKMSGHYIAANYTGK